MWYDVHSTCTMYLLYEYDVLNYRYDVHSTYNIYIYRYDLYYMCTRVRCTMYKVLVLVRVKGIVLHSIYNRL